MVVRSRKSFIFHRWHKKIFLSSQQKIKSKRLFFEQYLIEPTPTCLFIPANIIAGAINLMPRGSNFPAKLFPSFNLFEQKLLLPAFDWVALRHWLLIGGSNPGHNDHQLHIWIGRRFYYCLIQRLWLASALCFAKRFFNSLRCLK